MTVLNTYIGYPSILAEHICPATASLTIEQCSDGLINNYGQAADAVLTLPAAAKGLHFVVLLGTTVAKYLRLDPQSGDQIYLDGTGAGDGKYVGIASAAAGAGIEFWAIQTGVGAYDWVAITLAGTFAAESA